MLLVLVSCVHISAREIVIIELYSGPAPQLSHPVSYYNSISATKLKFSNTTN